MIASGTIIIDGQTYRKGDVIHDLGGWDCIDTDGSKRFLGAILQMIIKQRFSSESPLIKHSLLKQITVPM